MDLSSKWKEGSLRWRRSRRRLSQLLQCTGRRTSQRSPRPKDRDVTRLRIKPHASHSKSSWIRSQLSMMRIRLAASRDSHPILSSRGRLRRTNGSQRSQSRELQVIKTIFQTTIISLIRIFKTRRGDLWRSRAEDRLRGHRWKSTTHLKSVGRRQEESRI